MHTVPVEEDYLIGAFVKNCPKYDRLYAELIDGPAIQSVMNRYRNISDLILARSGFEPSNRTDDLVRDIVVTHDTLYIESIAEKPLPEWTEAFYTSPAFEAFIVELFKLPAYTTELARIRVGYVLKEILDRSLAKANDTLRPDRKVWAYSAHDLNISTMLYALNLAEVSTLIESYIVFE